jgi:hypothetical protein
MDRFQDGNARLTAERPRSTPPAPEPTPTIAVTTPIISSASPGEMVYSAPPLITSCVEACRQIIHAPHVRAHDLT